MTINKSQGQTLEQVGIHLKEPCFSHGQLYVTLSRARKSQNLSIFSYENTVTPEQQRCLQNVVAFEVLFCANIQQL